jgi:hypothetical protein
MGERRCRCTSVLDGDEWLASCSDRFDTTEKKTIDPE